MSALAEINTEIKSLVSIAMSNKTEHFKRSLSDKGINDSTASDILQSVSACEDIVLKTFDLFKTVKRIEKFMTDSEHYVAPQRMPLGTGEFQYVSVIKTLKKITNDPSFKKLRKRPENRSREKEENLDFCLADIDDGQRVREIGFFRENPDALR
jgi:hypothetical protein